MKTILVAEDRDTSRELIRELLEHSGYAVIEATNGAEAVELARAEHPDLVLLDIQMPVQDGFEVLRELRLDERFADMPIVALTANAMNGERERAITAGFADYLTKPLSFAAVRKELSRLLDQDRRVRG